MKNSGYILYMGYQTKEIKITSRKAICLSFLLDKYADIGWSGCSRLPRKSQSADAKKVATVSLQKAGFTSI